MTETMCEARCLPCTGLDFSNLYAWNDLRPPTPDYFHLTGEVFVPNPGVDPLLVQTEPQGPNPTILLLDLYLCQKPGFWPQVLVWKPVSFDKKIIGKYAEVQIMCEGKPIATVKVDDVF